MTTRLQASSIEQDNTLNIFSANNEILKFIRKSKKYTLLKYFV